MHEYTYTQALSAVTENGSSLQYIPTHLITPQLCLTAVSQDGHAIKFVPKALLNHDICLAAVKQKFHILASIPEDMRTVEMALIAVRRNNFLTSLVPSAMRCKHPLFIALGEKQDFPSPDKLDELMTMWLADSDIDRHEIKQVLVYAPPKIMQSTCYQKWALMLL